MYKKLISPFQRNEDGSMIIEFALILPVFLYLTFAIIEFGLILYASNTLENATVAGGRFGSTGSDYDTADYDVTGAGNAGTREEVIKRAIANNGGGILRPENINIQCQSLGQGFTAATGASSENFSCGTGANNATNNNNATITPCTDTRLGNGGSAVLYTVSYCWEVTTPFVKELFTDNQLVLESTLVTQNESF